MLCRVGDLRGADAEGDRKWEFELKTSSPLSNGGITGYVVAGRRVWIWIWICSGNGGDRGNESRLFSGAVALTCLTEAPSFK